MYVFVKNTDLNTKKDYKYFVKINKRTKKNQFSGFFLHLEILLPLTVSEYYMDWYLNSWSSGIAFSLTLTWDTTYKNVGGYNNKLKDKCPTTKHDNLHVSRLSQHILMHYFCIKAE